MERARKTDGSTDMNIFKQTMHCLKKKKKKKKKRKKKKSHFPSKTIIQPSKSKCSTWFRQQGGLVLFKLISWAEASYTMSMAEGACKAKHQAAHTHLIYQSSALVLHVHLSEERSSDTGRQFLLDWGSRPNPLSIWQSPWKNNKFSWNAQLRKNKQTKDTLNQLVLNWCLNHSEIKGANIFYNTN